MKVTLGGKPFTVRFGAFSTPEFEEDLLGVCYSDGRINVVRGLSDREELEILIHEALHACRWSASEKWVTQTAAEIASLLFKRGYRRAR